MKKLKFILLSLLAIFIFFIPINGVVPIVNIVNLFKKPFGDNLHYLSMLIITITFLEFIINLVRRKKTTESVTKKIFYVISFILVLSFIFNLNNVLISDERLVSNALNVAANVFLTILVAGSLVVLILKSGLVEFVAILVEPLVKPIFKLPGEAAIDILSAYVSSASVGVYMTSKHYEDNIFNLKEATSVATSFSVISVGYIAVLANLSNISGYYTELIISSFVLVLIMGFVMIRIWPLSKVSEAYYDETKPVKKKADYSSFKERFNQSLIIAEAKSDGFNFESVSKNFISSFNFARKTICIMVTMVSFVLFLVYYTNIFDYIAVPFIPILNLFQVADASLVAPSIMIGIVEVTLPSILVSATSASVEARFFVVLLSICQVIFFTECGNAILGSKIKVSVLKLIAIFIIRTMIAIPLVALVTKIIF